jgi:hypothetical protein
MKDFDLEQWLEREADRWYCKDQATIAKSSCLKGFNKAKELYEPRDKALQEYIDDRKQNSCGDYALLEIKADIETNNRIKALESILLDGGKGE